MEVPSAKAGIIFGLVVECPFGSPSEDCPMKIHRKKDLRERWEWVRQLDEKEADCILECHDRCAYERNLRQPLPPVLKG